MASHTHIRIQNKDGRAGQTACPDHRCSLLTSSCVHIFHTCFYPQTQCFHFLTHAYFSHLLLSPTVEKPREHATDAGLFESMAEAHAELVRKIAANQQVRAVVLNC